MPIRPYEAKDRDAVRYICLNSDGPCEADELGQHFLLTTYCDYYIEREPHNCFVFADEEDRAVGYILCTEDFANFRKVFYSDFKTRIDPARTAEHKWAEESIVPHAQHSADFPAHLHIDLLPDYQGKGIGTQLMNTLFAHLRNKKCRGIMLTVFRHNTGAVRFYERYGFDRIGENTNNIVFGKLL
ncbi:MAG: GNAT family N-acetyltransferase [Clostridia bacterium]|nr:GNAT family N-acetyltransferase [Clostridia bacterium]